MVIVAVVVRVVVELMVVVSVKLSLGEGKRRGDSGVFPATPARFRPGPCELMVARKPGVVIRSKVDDERSTRMTTT